MSRLVVCVFSLTVLLSTFSCKYKEVWELVNVDNQFTMEVPSWLEKTNELLPGAPFQYRNRFRNVYVIVNKEKQDTLPAEFSAYASRNISVLKAVLTNPMVSDSVYIALNGWQGLRTEVIGSMGEDKIFYTHYSLNGGDGFNYQLCGWTRGEERKLRYNEDINRILNSFKPMGR